MSKRIRMLCLTLGVALAAGAVVVGCTNDPTMKRSAYEADGAIVSQKVKAVWKKVDVTVAGRPTPIEYRKYEKPVAVEVVPRSEAKRDHPVNAFLSGLTCIPAGGSFEEFLEHFADPEKQKRMVLKHYSKESFMKTRKAKIAGSEILGQIRYKDYVVVVWRNPVSGQPGKWYYIGTVMSKRDGKYYIDLKAKRENGIFKRLSQDEYSIITGVKELAESLDKKPAVPAKTRIKTKTEKRAGGSDDSRSRSTRVSASEILKDKGRIGLRETTKGQEESISERPSGEISVKKSDGAIIVDGGYSEMPLQKALSKAFADGRSDAKVSVRGCYSSVGFSKLGHGLCHILVYCGKPRWSMHKRARDKLGLKKSIEYVTIGRYCVRVVVNERNPVSDLLRKQLHKILRMEIRDWSEVGGKAGKIVLCGEGRKSKVGDIVPRKVLRGLSWGNPYKELADSDAVAKYVSENPNAMGLYLDRRQEQKGVKCIAIRIGSKDPAYLPTLKNIQTGKYLITQDYRMYVHPKAPPLARELWKYAASQEGAMIAKKWCLYTEHEGQQLLALARLKEMKAGKGVAIKGVGSMGGLAVMRDLAVEYVKAKEVVQMACRPAVTELTAVGYFVNAKGRELLVLDGPVSEKAKKLHGKKWDFLVPQTHVLATGRGIAICVNSMNKLGSLTVEQVRHLFSKKTTTWRDVTGAEVKIKRYGLAGTDPAARVFYNLINPPAACARPEVSLGTQAVLGALSRDPHGIAFVDAAAANDLLDAAGAKSGIKVLSIGPKGKAATPTAANVKAGKYPISQRLTLHVSLRASQTTRGFVTFVLSGAADEVFTKHGLITPAQARKAQRQ